MSVINAVYILSSRLLGQSKLNACLTVFANSVTKADWLDNHISLKNDLFPLREEYLLISLRTYS